MNYLFSLPAYVTKPSVLPFYHMVSDTVPLHIKHLYKPKNIKQFIADLDFLLRNYEPVDTQTLLNYHTENKTRKPIFHLSFDDGLREMYEIVAPILRKKGVPATFFVNTGFIDNKELFYRFKVSLILEKLSQNPLLKSNIIQFIKQPDLDIAAYLLRLPYSKSLELDDIASLIELDFNDYLKQQQPYLSFDEINSLALQGFSIGAHSINHPLYKDLSLTEQFSQTIESVDYVVRSFNQPLRLFSFPFTDDGVSLEFFEKIASSVDLTFGTAGFKLDKVSFNLQRIPAEKMPANFRNRLLFQYVRYFCQSVIKKNIVIRH